MDSKNLSPEFLEKVKECTSPEELESLAKEAHQELSVDELDSASGGTGDCPYNCMWVCLKRGDYVEGDTREGIDPDCVRADFVDGSLNGGEYF